MTAVFKAGADYVEQAHEFAESPGVPLFLGSWVSAGMSTPIAPEVYG
jgi:hypothetical protein